MNILIIGGGGREHSVARSISISKNCNKIYILPGNAGTAEVGENIEGDVNDFNLIKKTVLSNQISVVFVGPEDPIVNGIYDFFKKEQSLKDIPLSVTLSFDVYLFTPTSTVLTESIFF